MGERRKWTNSWYLALIFLISNGSPLVMGIVPLKLPLSIQKTLKRDGYPSEVYRIETEDDYILKVHRIPREGAPPVYLQHGLLSNSLDWLKAGKSRALPYVLWERGFDVWIGNVRGNTYSREHKIYSAIDVEFWNFSWHEVGVYDLPAIINYIVKKTNQSVFCVCHSLGCAEFSVFASQKIKVAKNIHALVALAPSVYNYHIPHPLGKTIASFEKDLQALADISGIHEFLGVNSVFNLLINTFCQLPFLGTISCSEFVFYWTGYNPSQLISPNFAADILSQFPAGTSVKLFIHFLQSFKVNEFQQFDYGVKENLKRYGQMSPPKYDLTKIQVPIAIFLSDNDRLISVKDAMRFYQKIPNKLGLFDVGTASGFSFNHADFIYGINATELIHYNIVDIFKTL